MTPTALRVDAARIAQAHQLYCELTGQRLSLRFDRQRAWYELLRTGATLEQLAHLVRYLQREIRHGRRNVGALKLSNLLQPDRFEEDFSLSHIALHPPPPPRPTSLPSPQSIPPPPLDPQHIREGLRQLKAALR